MSYVKQTWDTTSYVTPTRMNYIENGIEGCAHITDWTSGDTIHPNWNYYQDSEGYWHLHYYESTAVSREFSTSEGNIYKASNVTISLPTTVGDIISVNADIQQGANACGVTVGSISSNQIALILWSSTSGSKNTRLSINVIAKPSTT